MFQKEFRETEKEKNYEKEIRVRELTNSKICILHIASERRRLNLHSTGKNVET